MILSDIKAIVTGGSSGIGLATALLLKEKGGQVVIASRSEDKLGEIATAHGLLFKKTDVSVPEDIEALFEYAINEMDGLNVLINNAGFGVFAPLLTAELSDFEEMWSVNTRGLFLCGQAAAHHFSKEKFGNIINIGSTAANRGFVGGTGYCASKFAVSGMTEAWRTELRPYNIRVTQVNPSEVVSDFAKRAGFEQNNTTFKLKSNDIAQVIVSMLALDDIAFIPNAEVWATNPNRE